MKYRRLLPLSLALALGLAAPALAAEADGTAYASTQMVLVDGAAVEFQAYALKDEAGNDTNYVKLRDVAFVLNGTDAQFEVDWDGGVVVTTKTPYTVRGGEMTTPYEGNQPCTAVEGDTNVDGKPVRLDNPKWVTFS